MAKMLEETIIIRVSKIVKDEDADVAPMIMDEDFVAGVEGVVSELLQDPKVLIEVLKD
jgi:hypothetical protein